MKEVQLVEEDREVLKDVGNTPEAIVEDLMSYDLNEPSLDCFFLTRSKLTEQERNELIEFLTINIEVFAWTQYEMPEIDPIFINHELNVIPKAKLVKQRGCRSAIEHVDAVIEEVKILKRQVP